MSEETYRPRMEDFFPWIPPALAVTTGHLVIARDKVADLLCGRAKIVNIPPGAVPRVGLLTERFADQYAVSVILEYRLLPAGGNVPPLRAEVAYSG